MENSRQYRPWGLGITLFFDIVLSLPFMFIANYFQEKSSPADWYISFLATFLFQAFIAFRFLNYFGVSLGWAIFISIVATFIGWVTTFIIMAKLSGIQG
jgi:hypothetical protein